MTDLSTLGGDPALRTAAARIAGEVYGMQALTWDRAGSPLPMTERSRLAELGYLGLTLPREYGGAGAPLADALGVLEEIAKESQIAAFPVFEANTGAARVIDLFGTADQKRRFLPRITSGQAVMAVAISEPGAGSAATDLSTTARLVNDSYVVRGIKRWCSGAGHSELYLVYVRLSEEAGAKGIGALIVERDAEGLSFGTPERLMGFRGIPSADMYFEDVRVPAANLIVREGCFGDLFTAFSIERLGNATMSLAIGQACLDRCASYVQERRQFGQDLASFQLVQAAIADMVVEVDAARLLIERAAAHAGHGAPLPLEASIAKCFANEMAKRVSDLAIQLHGGYGYAAEYGIERLHRDAIGWSLGGGTPNMQRIRIASEYLGRRFEQRA